MMDYKVNFKTKTMEWKTKYNKLVDDLEDKKSSVLYHHRIIIKLPNEYCYLEFLSNSEIKIVTIEDDFNNFIDVLDDYGYIISHMINPIISEDQAVENFFRVINITIDTTNNVLGIIYYDSQNNIQILNIDTNHVSEIKEEVEVF